MKAHITAYRPGHYDETSSPDAMVKDMFEYTQWLLRAGYRGYVAIRDDVTGTIYVVKDSTFSNNFEVHFEEE